MESKKITTKMKRVNTRIYETQDEFIKKEVAKFGGVRTEGEVHRELLDIGIKNYNKKK